MEGTILMEEIDFKQDKYSFLLRSILGMASVKATQCVFPDLPSNLIFMGIYKCYLANKVLPDALQLTEQIQQLEHESNWEEKKVIVCNDFLQYLVICFPNKQKEFITKHRVVSSPTLLGLIKEREEMKLFYVCKICWIEEAKILLLPCSHIASCNKCSEKLTMCPLCRSPVKRQVRVYRS
jgi:hypothetical protein